MGLHCIRQPAEPVSIVLCWNPTQFLWEYYYSSYSTADASRAKMLCLWHTAQKGRVDTHPISIHHTLEETVSFLCCPIPLPPILYFLLLSQVLLVFWFCIPSFSSEEIVLLLYFSTYPHYMQDIYAQYIPLLCAKYISNTHTHP